MSKQDVSEPIKGELIKVDEGWFWPVCEAFNIELKIMDIKENSITFIPK